MSDIRNLTTTTWPFISDPSLIGLDQNRQIGQIVLEIISLVAMWIASVLGNILVCVVIHRSRRMQSTTNYFIVSLACADLTAAVVCAPLLATRISTNRWILGPVLCKFIRFVQYLVPCVNMFVMVAICIDRFYTIIYPLSFKITRGTAKKLIAFSWTFATILCCLNFYFFEALESPTRSNTQICPTYIPVQEWTGIVYTLCVVICQFLVPLIIMVVGYTRVFKHIWRTGFGPRHIQRTTNPVPRTKVKMVKMLIIVTHTTVLSYLPFYMVQLWYCLDQAAFSNPTIFVFVALLMLSNGVSKPLIYLCYNSNFRRGCKEVFCMSTMKCYRSNRYAITNASSLSKKNHVGIMEPIGISEMTTVQESPSHAFNRAQQLEKSVWPLNNVPPTSYM